MAVHPSSVSLPSFHSLPFLAAVPLRSQPTVACLQYPVLRAFHFTSSADIAAAVEIVDQDGDGFISRVEFREICVVLPYCSQFRDEQKQKRWCGQRRSCNKCCCAEWRKTARYKRIRQITTGWQFEQVVNFVVLCNVLTILAELQFEYEPVGQFASRRA
eukprot:SAG22_NODE_223_length_14745_cov_16.175065_2_plen_159_part_00